MNANVDDPLLILPLRRGERHVNVPLKLPIHPDRLDRLLADDRRYRVGPPPASPDTGTGAGDGSGMPMEKVELVLYVSTSSIACAKAVASLRSVVAQFPPDRVTLEVRDVTQHPEAAARDRILFTPTLLCGTPLPMVRVLGDMSNRAVLIDLLRTAGLDHP